MSGAKKSTGTTDPGLLGNFRPTEMWPIYPELIIVKAFEHWGFPIRVPMFYRPVFQKN